MSAECIGGWRRRSHAWRLLLFFSVGALPVLGLAGAAGALVGKVLVALAFCVSVFSIGVLLPLSSLLTPVVVVAGCDDVVVVFTDVVGPLIFGRRLRGFILDGVAHGCLVFKFFRVIFLLWNDREATAGLERWTKGLRIGCWTALLCLC